MWTLFHTRKILIIYLTGLNCPLFTHHNLCLRTHFLFLCNEHQRNRSEHIRLNLHRNCMSESVALQKVCHREKKCQIFSYQWLLASMRWRQKWYSYDFEMFFFFIYSPSILTECAKPHNKIDFHSTINHSKRTKYLPSASLCLIETAQCVRFDDKCFLWI